MTTPTSSPAQSSFDPPPEEQRWIALAEELAGSIARTAAERDESAELPVEALRALNERGLDLALVPAALGGGGMSARTFGRVLGIIARACPSTACVWLMHVGAAVGLITLGDEAMAAHYTAELRAGKRFANALSEPGSGNLFLYPLQKGEPAEGGWTLRGAKRFVSGGEIADHFMVNALVDGAPSFFGVARDETIGFEPIWDAMGMRATRSQLMTLDGTLLRRDRGCRAPAPADPNPIAYGLAWLSIGVAEAALDALKAHARGRVLPTTGQPIAELQWIQMEVADAHVTLQAARLLAARTMWLADVGSPEALGACLEAKLFANQAAKQIADLGVRVGGASGYLKSSPIQRHFRDAQAGWIMAYSAEVCRDFIGKAVLGAGGPGGGAG